MEQYKTDFDRIYTEYLEAHNYLERVAKLFQSHKMELESINDKSSREYDEKAKKIYKDYMEKLNDSDYLKQKDKHEKLFNELNFIQDLIKQYQSSAN
jgi:Skp family chaperone for outer membrane proteins